MRKTSTAKLTFKRSRKLIAGFTAGIMMVCVLSVTAFADDESTSIGKGESSQSASTSLNYKVNPDYTVVIPKAVALTSSETSMNITATKINAEPDYQVQVKVSAGLTDGKVMLERTNDTGYKIYAPLKLGTTTVTDSTAVAAFSEHDTAALTGTGTLTFGVPEDSTGSTDVKAGDYTGTVTFQVAYTYIVPVGN